MCGAGGLDFSLLFDPPLRKRTRISGSIVRRGGCCLAGPLFFSYLVKLGNDRDSREEKLGNPRFLGLTPLGTHNKEEQKSH